ncbi:WYL domain-containing protein [Nocardia sp. NPDC024068]|uniref:helix-turn-helix transcriptional regulator n=1 Tax=Nocardia sp. NPDC024068 TaxID=3157197 RepID=UPI0033F509D3
MTPDRFFGLLLALQSRPVTTTAALSDELGVSVRTVLRDLNWLQEAGFPVHARQGRGGGVTLLPGGALDTSRLTPGDRDHLVLTGLDDQQRDDLGAAADSDRARRKVAPAKPGAEGLLPLSGLVVTDNRPWFAADSGGASPAELVGDLRRGVRLRVLYRRSDESGPVWRVADPYGLLAKSGRWYLVADERETPRLFLLDRIARWQALRLPRRLRAGATLHTVAAQLTARWETTGELLVHAELDIEQLDRAGRILGTRLTVHEAVADRRARVTITCRVLDDTRQLLQFANHLTVLAPPEARTLLRDLAAGIRQQYS